MEFFNSAFEEPFLVVHIFQDRHHEFLCKHAPHRQETGLLIPHYCFPLDEVLKDLKKEEFFFHITPPTLCEQFQYIMNAFTFKLYVPCKVKLGFKSNTELFTHRARSQGM